MSAGYDSRVILSSLLAAGSRPTFVTMGFDNSTDVVVSRWIAKSLGSDIHVVELDIGDYVRDQKQSIALQTAQSLHPIGTRTCTQRSAVHAPGVPFFVGWNGSTHGVLPRPGVASKLLDHAPRVTLGGSLVERLEEAVLPGGDISGMSPRPGD